MRRLSALLMLLGVLLAPSLAQAKCYIREYQNEATVGTTRVPVAPEAGTNTDQVVDPSGGVASSSAFQKSTNLVRLICGASVSFVFGASPQTATTSNAPLPAMTQEYFAVVPGQVVSIILNASP